jgi:hypothetical protein
VFADELKRAIESADRLTLPQVTALLWRAYGEGKVTEAEAEALSVLIEARRSSESRPSNGQSPNPTGTDPEGVRAEPRKLVEAARRAVGSRPRTDASMERRRRWAASGRLPPGLAARFTLAEQAVLALVAAEVARRKDCRLSVENMAAVAGVCRSTVKNAIREAQRLGLLTVEERQVTGWRNDTNIVGIVSREWTAWLRLARRTLPSGGGVKSVTTTPTQVLNSRKTRAADPSRRRSASPNPAPQAPSRTAGA